MQSMEKNVSFFFFIKKAKAINCYSLELCYPAMMCFWTVEMELNS